MKMIKENKTIFIITTILTLFPMYVGLILWNKLPSQLPTHYDFAGTPDRYDSRSFVVFFFGLYLLLIHILLTVATSVCEKKGKSIGKMPLRACLWICPSVGIFLSAIIYPYSLGFKMDVTFWAMIFFGVMFIILGNYMPKIRQNHVMGTRVKWTLDSKKNWAHTHRFTGWIMCVCGALFILLASTNGLTALGPVGGPIVLLIIVLSFALSSVLYSYLYYKNHKGDEDYYE